MTGYVVENTNCRVCCENTPTEMVFEWGSLNLQKCSKCGTVFAGKRLRKEDLVEISKNTIPSMFNDPLLGKKKEIARTTEAHWQLDLIEKHVKIGKVFDVGAAGGTFLSVARARGWKITGNEISDACIYVAKNKYSISLHKNFVENEVADGTYDAVVLWNVLEHLYEPLLAFKHIYNMLSSTGVILIKIPLHTEETIKKYHMLPDHTHNYTRTSLDTIFTRIGYKILKEIDGFDDEIPTLIILVGKN